MTLCISTERIIDKMSTLINAIIVANCKSDIDIAVEQLLPLMGDIDGCQDGAFTAPGRYLIEPGVTDDYGHYGVRITRLTD